MKKVQSADGTIIAFDQLGKGPAVILVGGALEQRAMDSETAQLAPLLAQHFTVFHYDRRGRGDSTDTLPYAVEREIEDIEALINEAGGSAFVFGIHTILMRLPGKRGRNTESSLRKCLHKVAEAMRSRSL